MNPKDFAKLQEKEQKLFIDFVDKAIKHFKEATSKTIADFNSIIEKEEPSIEYCNFSNGLLQKVNHLDLNTLDNLARISALIATSDANLKKHVLDMLKEIYQDSESN